MCAAVAKLLQSCPTLCNSIDSSPPGSPIPGILWARTLEWVSHFLHQCMKMKSESEVAPLCPTLSDPMDCSLPGSSVHGIFQARVLEWGTIAFSSIVHYYGEFPWWLIWWRICLQCRKPGFDPWIRKIPWRRKWHPTPVSLPGKFTGSQRVGHDWVTELNWNVPCAVEKNVYPGFFCIQYPENST